VAREWVRGRISGVVEAAMSIEDDDRGDRASLTTSGRLSLKRSDLSTARRISVHALLNDDAAAGDDNQCEAAGDGSGMLTSQPSVDFSRGDDSFPTSPLRAALPFQRSDSANVFWSSSVSMTSSPSPFEIPSLASHFRPPSATSQASSMRSAVSSSADSGSSSRPRASNEIDVYVYDSMCDPAHVLGQLLLAPTDSVADLRAALAAELIEAHPQIATGAFDIVRSDGVIVISDFDQFPLARCLRAPVEHVALFWR
jgi:hypothetical protein